MKTLQAYISPDNFFLSFVPNAYITPSDWSYSSVIHERTHKLISKYYRVYQLNAYHVLHYHIKKIVPYCPHKKIILDKLFTIAELIKKFHSENLYLRKSDYTYVDRYNCIQEYFGLKIFFISESDMENNKKLFINSLVLLDKIELLDKDLTHELSQLNLDRNSVVATYSTENSRTKKIFLKDLDSRLDQEGMRRYRAHANLVLNQGELDNYLIEINTEMNWSRNIELLKSFSQQTKEKAFLLINYSEFINQELSLLEVKKVYPSIVTARGENPSYGQNYLIAQHDGHRLVRLQPLYEKTQKILEIFCNEINAYLEKEVLEVGITSAVPDSKAVDSKHVVKI